MIYYATSVYRVYLLDQGKSETRNWLTRRYKNTYQEFFHGATSILSLFPKGNSCLAQCDTSSPSLDYPRTICRMTVLSMTLVLCLRLLTAAPEIHGLTVTSTEHRACLGFHSLYRTLLVLFSESLPATIAPAVPPPTTMKSYSLCVSKTPRTLSQGCEIAQRSVRNASRMVIKRSVPPQIGELATEGPELV